MENIKLLLQGFIIGIGKIIPGVSGAMFAMIFGVYEKSLNIISNLKTELKGNLKFIILLGSSIFLAIVFGSGIIKKCLENYYLITMFLFIGMMLGGIKPLFKNVKGSKIKPKNIVLAILISLILLITSLIDIGGKEEILVKTPLTFLILIICGFLDALATVVPGICGTALLMILGYYNQVIIALSDVFNLSNLSNNLFILIPFGFGIILGVFLVSKALNYLFKNYKVETYYCIILFAIMSILILLIKALVTDYTTQQLISSCIFLVVGYLITHCLEKLDV